jgi:hypothetical protein
MLCKLQSNALLAYLVSGVCMPCFDLPVHCFLLQASVYAASREFLKRLSTRMQEESINWGQRHDDDLQSKDRDLEVGCVGMPSCFTIDPFGLP